MIYTQESYFMAKKINRNVRKNEIAKNIQSYILQEKRKSLSIETITDVIDCFLFEVKQTLVLNRTVELRTFGTFRVIKKNERVSPRQDEKSEDKKQIPAHGYPSFRPCKELREYVWDVDPEEGPYELPDYTEDEE